MAKHFLAKTFCKAEGWILVLGIGENQATDFEETKIKVIPKISIIQLASNFF
jgi:precorrin-6B methylase 1